jgi:DNA-binding CsgD family transcriptional regulator
MTELQHKIKELNNQGFKDTEIAEFLKLKVKKVRYHRNKLGLNSPKMISNKEEIKDYILIMFKQGLQDKEIALSLNISPSSVYSIRKKLGLERKKVSNKIEISKELDSFLLGTLLGDSTIYLDKNCINSRYTCSHNKEQKEYIDFKYKILEPLKPKISFLTPKYPDKRTNKYYSYYRIFTGNNENLNYYRNIFYPDNIKIIPVNKLDNFNALSLACLFMDDGYYSRNSIKISTNSFQKENLQQFIKFLYNKFELKFTIHKDNSIYLSAKSFEKFKNIVNPYILSCFNYKLGQNGSPV